MKAIRVLGVISSSKMGGAERYFSAWAKGLAGLGVELHVACPKGPMAADYSAAAATATELEMPDIFRAAAAAKLSRLIRRTRAQVVHTHLWNADVLGGLAARHAGAPVLVSTVYGAYHLPVGGNRLRTLKQRTLSSAYRAIYRLFDQVVAVSDYVRRDLAQRAGVRLESGRVTVIDPALQPGPPAPARPPAVGFRSARGPRIVCVANFFPIKGQESLLRALPRLRSAHPTISCLFIGDGPERQRLSALAARLRIEGAVSFAGSVEDPRAAVAESDLLVLPSLSEGLPHSILEAWSLGTPVVASRAGGIPEAVEDGRDALLVPPGDPDALSGAVLSLLGDDGLRARLAEGGGRTLARRFSVEAVGRATLQLYRRLLPMDPRL